MPPKPKMWLLNWLLLISLALVYFSDQVNGRNIKKTLRKFKCELPRIRHAEFKIINKRSAIARCLENYVLVSKSGRRLRDKVLKLKCNKTSGKIEGKEGAKCMRRRRRHHPIQNDDPVDKENEDTWISYNAVPSGETDQDIVLLTGERDGAKVAYETAFSEYDDDDYIQYDYEGDYEAPTGPGEDYGQFYDYDYDDYSGKELVPNEEETTTVGLLPEIDISNVEGSGDISDTELSTTVENKTGDGFQVPLEKPNENQDKLVKEKDIDEAIDNAEDEGKDYDNQDKDETHDQIDHTDNEHNHDHDVTDQDKTDQDKKIQDEYDKDEHNQDKNYEEEYDQDENHPEENDLVENVKEKHDQDESDQKEFDQSKNSDEDDDYHEIDQEDYDRDENDQEEIDQDEYDHNGKEDQFEENDQTEKQDHHGENVVIKSKEEHQGGGKDEDIDGGQGEYDEEGSSEYDYDEEDDGVNEEQDPETEQLYRSYEILSEFYKRHFVDLRVLDASCDPSEVPPPKVHHGTVKEYLTSDNVLLPGERYHEVIYECDEGFKLTEGMLGHMFCQQEGWMGVEPYCEEDPDYKSKLTIESSRTGTSVENACEHDQGCEHQCTMIDGKPTCVCPEGYEVIGVTNCMDIDECLTDNGGCSQICVNKPGTYTCECKDGYRSDGTYCMDINECVANNGHGPCQDTCSNHEGGYTCSCEGLPGTVLTNDGKNCREIDLCEDNNAGCSHECYTSYGQAYCMCPDGYALGNDWKTCSDVNECEDDDIANCGPGRRCQNTEGSFECVPVELDETLCDEGYIFDPETNICKEIDKCIDNPCGNHGTCIREGPEYSCDCKNGFRFDGESCVDIDECTDDPERCVYGECLNTIGGFTCSCYNGFRIDMEEMVCKDMNECSEKEMICGEHGICHNTHGSYDCKCKEGYEVNKEGICEDIDECLNKTLRCRGKKVDCINLDGSYECRCHTVNRVYDYANRKCKKAKKSNPCKVRPSVCGDNAACKVSKNAIHGFECLCKDGFVHNSTSSNCEDVNECKIDNGGCQHHCENSNGSFRCLCKTGYIQDPENPMKCIDFDECKEMTHHCHQKCTNLKGSYECGCHEGYLQDPDNSSKCIMDNNTVPVPNEGQERKKKRKHKNKKKKKKKPKGCKSPDQVPGDELILAGLEDYSLSRNVSLVNGLYPIGTLFKGKCKYGYVLGNGKGRIRKRCKKDGSWIGTNGTCTQITCIEIADLSEGVVVTPESCTLSRSPVKTQCKFSCSDPDYKLIGSRFAKCKKTSIWKYSGGMPKCVMKNSVKKRLEKEKRKKLKKEKRRRRKKLKTTTTATTNEAPVSKAPVVVHHPTPFIYCPPDVVKDLPADSPTVYVRIPQPKSNMNWYDNVKANPAWAKKLEAELGLGRTQVTFQASSPFTDKVASCSFTIHVRDTIPPRVYNCPTDFNVYLENGEKEKRVHWEEPVFADNVKITHVMASKLPGYYLREGKYDVLYQAADEDGNKARCVFTINVLSSGHVPTGHKSWVLCQVGSTGRSIKLFLNNVPRGCKRLEP